MSPRFTSVKTAVSAAYGQLRIEQDMLALLKEYESLRPAVLDRHAEPALVRARPGMAQAVRILQRRRGTSVPGDAPAITSQDIAMLTSGSVLQARVYTPAGPGPHPIVVYFHGGGWVTGSVDADDASARGIAAHARAIVVSVAYRLAPEHRFPAAWDDALSAWCWVHEHATNLNGDASRMALAGEGAGANLALATALDVRDAELPTPAHVLAVCPITQTGTNTASYLEHAVARPLNRAMMLWYFERLLLRREDLFDRRLQLVDANLAELPPVTLLSAQIDPLRSDAQKLKEALVRARVPVEWKDFDGVTHGFFGAAAVVEKAAQAQQYAGQRLAAALAQPHLAAHRSSPFTGLSGAFRQLLPAYSLGGGTAPAP